MYSLTGTLFKANAFRIYGKCNLIRSVQMKVQPFVRTSETVEQKNIRRKLPTSAGFGVYKPQITTVLSITHRITGLFLATFTTSFAFSRLLSTHDFSESITMVEGLELGDGTMFLLKLLFVYPFGLHACCGVRHLLWDTGRFLSIKEVYATGYAALAGSFIVAGLLAML